MTIVLWFSLGVLLISLWMFLEVAFGHRRLKYLRDMPLTLVSDLPKVSIVLAALNEAGTIEPALRSVLRIDYSNLEVIAVNDRSTDGTAAILDELSRIHPLLRVVHIHDLPPHWLGKNHALYQGAGMATGDYLLFTDADVVFEPSAITRAVAYCEQNRLDHLTIFPQVPTKEPLLAMLLLRFKFALFLRYKPWKVRLSRRHFLGLGAFNMIRNRVYREVGGHQAIALAVLDDLMLGKMIKMKGFRQDVLVGMGMISVEWYRNARAMFKGLQKNVFAAFDYRLDKLTVITILFLVITLWPWIGLFATDGIAQWINFAAVVAESVFYLDFMRHDKWSRRCLLYLPVSSLLSIVMWWQGSLLALIRQEIDWRGTRYSLAELRQGNFKA